MKKIILALFLLTSGAIFSDEESNHQFIGNLSQYKPTYLLFGDQHSQVKSQISLKYMVFEPLNLYFAFSEKFWWAVYDNANSSPITELNYNPEVFIKIPIYVATFRFLQLTPFEHTSNGSVSGSLDRGWNSSGLKISQEIKTGIIDIDLSYKFYVFWGLLNQNNDIYNYMGFSSYRIGLKPQFTTNNFIDKEEISFKINASEYPGYEVDIKFRTLLPKFTPCILIQFNWGYGESLVNYNIKDTAIRIGLMFQ